MENMYCALYSILILVFICGCHASKLRIVDGDIVKYIEKYPFMASIRVFSNSFCGGTIISRRYVLTAAHCVYQINKKEPLPPRFASVRVGSLSKSSGGKIYQVEEIKLNPYWTKFENTAYSAYGDLALIKLKEDIEYNEKVQPVILPAAKNYSVPIGSTVTVLGYGLKMETKEVLQDKLYKKNDVLRSTKMQVYNDQKCTKDWEEYMNTLENEVDRDYIVVNMKKICLKGERDICDGDSGGPVLDEHNVQVGVISFSNNCSQTEILLPSPVTDVRKWLRWINQELWKEV